MSDIRERSKHWPLKEGFLSILRKFYIFDGPKKFKLLVDISSVYWTYLSHLIVNPKPPTP